MLKRDEVIFLLGAGASVEASIPDSETMIRRIEEKVRSGQEDWSKFRDLYNYIRSAIFYAYGLNGTFGGDVPYNIERLVNVLDEIQKKERHVLYPFVGSWNHKLQDLAGSDLGVIRDFRGAIIRILRNEWMMLSRDEQADYYSGLLRFQKEYQHPLRVFSLNYDLCVEKSCGLNRVQRGFADRKWDWRLFDETLDDPLPIFLYKLHGSIDWRFDDQLGVTYVDSSSIIKDDSLALIFGTMYKLKSVDPFLYLAFELRRWTLDSVRIIVCVGYSFNDEHINGILKQSLRQRKECLIVAVVGESRKSDVPGTTAFIAQRLESNEAQIKVIPQNAKLFLTSTLSIGYLEGLIPSESEDFIELS